MKKAICLILMLFMMLCMLPLFSACEFGNEIKYELCNPNADKETVMLFDYLKSIYGKKTLSGINTTNINSEAYVVYRETGMEPAIRAYDMINMTQTSWKDDTVDNAIQWHTESNGIVAFCWHWIMPNRVGGGASAYTNDTAFRLTQALVEGTEENQKLNADLDKIAEALEKLRDNHTPVLWRPMHEASGGWFWWGASGAELYKQLWNYMYDKFTNEYNLTNLIWVWEGESIFWYVGDDKCDIVARDWYFLGGMEEPTYYFDSGFNQFDEARMWCNNKKMVAFSEVDQIPSVENMYDVDKEMQAPWLYICPWMGTFITSEYSTPFDQLRKYYEDKRIIKLSDLPEWDDDKRHELGRGIEYGLEHEQG